jgi:hypothetical protein
VSSQQGPLGLAEALAKLNSYLSDEQQREAFAQNSDDALQAAGIPSGVIPENTMKALDSLSASELEAFWNVGQGLERDGMAVDLPGELGRVFFF